MMRLLEGLREGDLSELVLNQVSIDEYESKLDDDSIVIAFFVKDRDPADDLNRFIQKGAVEILDTDVSPAPNEDGDYMVFIEVLRDEDFPKKTMDMLNSVNSLTGLDEWRAIIYDVEEPVAVTLENLSRLVRLTSEEDHGNEDSIEESLTEFFRASDLDDMTLEENVVTLHGPATSMSLGYVDLGSIEDLREHNAVLSQGLRLDEAAQHNVSRLQGLLGDLWAVEHLDHHVLLSNSISESCLLLRL